DSTPTGADAVTVRLTSSNPDVGSTPVVNFSNVGATMTVGGGAGTNSLVFHGTSLAETINVSRTIGALTLEDVGRQIVTPAGTFTSWTIEGGDGAFGPGADTININEPAGINTFQL